MAASRTACYSKAYNTSCYKVNVEWNAIGIGIDSYSGLLDPRDVWNVLNPIHLSHLRILDKLNKEKHSELESALCGDANPRRLQRQSCCG